MEAESGFNDPPVVLLVTLVASDAWGRLHPGLAALQVGYEPLIGAAVGLLVGRAGQWILARIALPAAGLYPLATLALPLLAFGMAGVAHASGFLVAYITGLRLGNAPCRTAGPPSVWPRRWRGRPPGRSPSKPLRGRT